MKTSRVDPSKRLKPSDTSPVAEKVRKGEVTNVQSVSEWGEASWSLTVSQTRPARTTLALWLAC